MKPSELKIGGLYRAVVGGKLTTVRLDSIGERAGRSLSNGYDGRSKGRATATAYHVTNMATGREVTFKSAAKFRSGAKPPVKVTLDQNLERAEKDKVAVAQLMQEGEHRADFSATFAETPSPTPRTQPDKPTAGSAEVPSPGGSGQNGTPAVDSSPSGGAATGLYFAGGRDKPAPLTAAQMEDTADVFTRSMGNGLAARLTAAPTSAKHPPTEEQQHSIDTVLRERVTVIPAGAGCGKTSDLKMIAERFQGTITYTTFTKALIAEGSKSFPSHVQCKSNHGLAFAAWGHKFAHRLNGRRVMSYEMARALGLGDLKVPGIDAAGLPKEKNLSAALLTGSLRAAIKRFCESADREVGPKHFGKLNGLPPESQEMVVEHLLPFARRAWEDMTNPEGTLPFSHDVYLKLFQLNDPVIAADCIMVDEFQDTNPCMLSIIEQQRHCKVVVVGDSNQTIYGWRGCIDALKAFPGATRCPLSQSFRFGEAVAEVANRVLSCLSEPTDLVLKGLPSIPSRIERLDRPRCILCRTNACAVSNLLAAIGEGRKPHLIGGGEDVVWFVEAAQLLQRGKPTSHPELCCFESWREVLAYVKTEEGADLKLLVDLVKKFGADEILGALRNMPDEKDADLVISTAHKAKGKEWETVKLAQDFPTMDRCDDEAIKLTYVAATRARLILDPFDCPFFAGGRGGEGENIPGLNIDKAIQIGKEAAAKTRPKAEQAPAGFTWTKWKDAWLVRGPKGASGTVTVTKKSGQSSREQLGRAVWENGTVAIYELAAKDAPKQRSRQGDACAAYGKGGALVRDLEDGLMKHRGCCDIEP